MATAQAPSSMDNTTCLELALEGERLCKAGDCRAGVAFFEAAIQAGTDDLKTLSAIYSQLGNAYFYLGDYVKAMQFHKHDLTLARTMGDRLGEAKASGNLGNTLKVMGRFEEAIICCKRHLEISRELGDKVGEGRALYNLGNVFHAQGKHLGRMGQQDPGDFPDEVKACLQQAVKYYEDNLNLMVEIGDRAAQGRACGNLGNTHYLLGNFLQAIKYHEERLRIAKEFGDKSAERRAHSNLGNAHVFLGEFEVAAENYKKTLSLAQELGDRAVEAQACYSLGNTYTLLRDYSTAIEYHLKHLKIAEELLDKVGEGRACWSLGNAHAATGDHEKALSYAKRHLEISKEIGDETGQATAQMNVNDLQRALGLPVTECIIDGNGDGEFGTPTRDMRRPRRPSMENMDLLKMTPDVKLGLRQNVNNEDKGDGLMMSLAVLDDRMMDRSDLEDPEQDDFFELLSRFQSKRMDDQRCALKPRSASVPTANGLQSSHDSVAAAGDGLGLKDDLMDLIAGIQGRRLDEQRASLPCLPSLPGLNSHTATGQDIFKRLSVASAASVTEKTFPDDDFFDQLMRCQGTRIEDQRSHLPTRGPTVPDEDFYSLIMRFQSERLDDQRSNLPARRERNGHLPALSSAPPPPSASAPTDPPPGGVSRLLKSVKK